MTKWISKHKRGSFGRSQVGSKAKNINGQNSRGSEFESVEALKSLGSHPDAGENVSRNISLAAENYVLKDGDLLKSDSEIFDGWDLASSGEVLEAAAK